MITLDYLNKYERDYKNYNPEISRITRDINLEYKKTTKDSASGSSNVFHIYKDTMK